MLHPAAQKFGRRQHFLKSRLMQTDLFRAEEFGHLAALDQLDRAGLQPVIDRIEHDQDIGLAHVLLPLGWADPAAGDALENITEWWAGVIFTVFFFVLAWAWRSTGFRLRLSSGSG